MKANIKKWLALIVAAMMVVGMALPAMATESTVAKAGKVQITKKLKIGQGIVVPDETFSFTFAPATTNELADELKNVEGFDVSQTSGYIDPDASNSLITYPTLNDVSVPYSSSTRTAKGTDTELTFMTPEIDLNSITWPAAGQYIYSVKENVPASPTEGMTYDAQTYYLRIYIKNTDNGGTAVDSAIVMGKDGDKWVKVQAEPNPTEEPYTSSNNDGCKDYEGNGFCFTNIYSKLVDRHLVNENDPAGETSLPGDDDHADWAFKLTKKVTGAYANTSSSFGFEVTVVLPDTYTDDGTDADVLKAVSANGYTANQILGGSTYSDDQPNVEFRFPNDGKEHNVFLKHGESFGIKKLPAGTVVIVNEMARSGESYVPSYSGKWGLAIDEAMTGSGSTGGSLQSDDIIVGDHGAYIQYNNELKDTTPTGIVISNLPYILMVGIALAGIGFFMVGKKRG